MKSTRESGFFIMALGSKTYAAVTWTTGDIATETKFDNMVNNDQAYDAHAAEGYLSNNNVGFYQKDSGGTNRELLNINGSNLGYVGSSDVDFALRTRVKAKTYRDSSGQAITAPTVTKLQLNGESFDPGSDFDNATNYRYTAPVAGYYIANINVRFGVTADQDIIAVFLYKNGSEVCRSVRQAAGATNQTVSLFTMVSLAASDYLEVYVQNATNNDTIDNGESLTWAEFFLHSIS